MHWFKEPSLLNFMRVITLSCRKLVFCSFYLSWGKRLATSPKNIRQLWTYSNLGFLLFSVVIFTNSTMKCMFLDSRMGISM